MVKIEVWELVLVVVMVNKGEVFLDVIVLFGEGFNVWIVMDEMFVDWMVKGNVVMVKLGVGDIKIK